MLSRRWSGRALAIALAVACFGTSSGVGSEKPPAGADPEAERLYGLALDRWIERSARVQRIAQRLRLAGRELCGDRLSPVLGAALLDLSELPEDLAEPAERRFGDDEGVYAIEVFEGAAAAAAGLERGDRIVRLDGDRVRKFEDVDRRQLSAATLALGVARGGSQLDVRLAAEPGCGFPALLQMSEAVSAHAQHRRIVFNTALLREIDDDAVLAVVVGHELAHHVLMVDRRGAAGSSITVESRADYLGIYLAAMAGYPVPEQATLHSTLARHVNFVAAESRSHPTGPARVLALRKTLDEIEAQLGADQPIRLVLE